MAELPPGPLKGTLWLGSTAPAASVYDPGLLCVLSRQEQRLQLPGFDAKQALPFEGVDIWTAYEFSWLDVKGKPQVAVLSLKIPCDSPGMVESKSLKLYFNSFNQSRFDSVDHVASRVQADLSEAVGAAIDIERVDVDAKLSRGHDAKGDWSLNRVCLDYLDIEMSGYCPDPDLLCMDESSDVVDETLYSHLFRSNCPVTGQPDWASVYIHYRGRKISHESLLKYLCSYRTHSGFHEQCIENIFIDLIRQCACEGLTVEARFLRRGGIDINPFRTNCGDEPLEIRSIRQ